MNRLHLLSFIWLLACGSSPSGISDAGSDGAPVDSGVLPDASGSCVAGSSRVVACGNCGSMNEVCSPSGAWMPLGACIGSGVCAAGAVEAEAAPRCGIRERVCDAACSWGDWMDVAAPGECESGQERRDEVVCGPSAVQIQTCQSDCTWSPPSECIDLCRGTRRTTPADAEEVCIPAGPFMRGWEAFFDAQPVREVTLSPYYIDRYPVTNERYRECVTLGACTAPTSSNGYAALIDSTRQRNPVQGVSRAQALAFCMWDGGRALPTEAQWEKAARGPSPRVQAYTWGSEFECDRVDCTLPPSPFIRLAIDEIADVRSYYGVERMVGGGFEWVFDAYSSSYYATDESLIDPTGPEGGGFFVLHGQPSGSFAHATSSNISHRLVYSEHSFPELTTFRCARTPRDP